MGLKDSIKQLSDSLGFGRNEEPSSSSSSDDEELDLNRLQESESESDIDDSEDEDEEEDEKEANESNEEEDKDDEEEDEDVALSEAELDDDADVIPYQKVTINNQAALRRSLQQIELPTDAKKSFVEHLSITTDSPIELRDVYDDTERELAFYKQALNAAIEGRKLAKKAGIAFSRPVDYFAEMVKSDEHMLKVKGKLLEQEKIKRASQEARKQRELKKYGKKVQHEKLQQRAKDKREVLDKIQGLKRKRKNADIDGDQFSVEVEDALTDKKRSRDEKFKLGNQRGAQKKQPNRKRMAKNQKYGSGHRRGEKKNTADSSMDVSGFSNRRRK